MGEHVKPGLHGRKRGGLLGKQKEFGTGSYADAPFRFRGIQEQASQTWVAGGRAVESGEAESTCERISIVRRRSTTKIRTLFIASTSTRGDVSTSLISSGVRAACKSVFFFSSNGTFGSAPPASSGAISCGDLECV